MQKYVNRVDLVKSFPTSIYLQRSASIQPRTSLSKFVGKFNSFFVRLLGHDTPAFGASAPASGVNSARSSQAPSAITSGRASPAFYSPAMHLLEPVEEASDSDDIPLQGDFLAGKAWADDDGEQSSERNL